MAIESLRTVSSPDAVQRSSLDHFGHELVRRAEGVDLPPVKGELRDSYGYTWALQGTFGSRAHQKRRYAQVERLLLRDVEPWAALARRRDNIDRRSFLRAAWRPLLLCQPHDTLCGCSIDDVAAALSGRLDESQSAGEELRHASLMSLVGHDGNEARRRPEEWSSVILVRNAAPRARSGVAEIDVDLLLGSSQSRQVEQIPRYPAVKRDFSLLFDKGTQYATVHRTIADAGIPELIRVEPFDRMESGPFPDNKYSLSISVVYQSPERTLTDVEVESFDRKIIDILEGRLSAQLRK